MSKSYYIGWDVGAWNCDKNPKSRDAIFILNDNANLIGIPWRGNLKETINNSKSTEEFISSLFALCGAVNTENRIVTMAIDAPLGFSDGLRNLLNGTISNENIESHHTNPYLFRQTEKRLFEIEHSPLSSIKDMIGSQTTKAMHVVAKFAPNIESCGVWADSDGKLKIIETYPAACKELKLRNNIDDEYQDIKDALICAEIAFIFETDNGCLDAPLDEMPKEEGWIWILKKCIKNKIEEK